jgi:hypothetical protein
MGWPKPPPGLWGWSGHPKRPKKKNKKRSCNGFGLLGVAGPPPRAWGGFGHPLPAVGGGFGHAQALGGGPATPKGQTHSSVFFFFFFVAFRGGRTTPKGLGVASATPIRPIWGGQSHPLAKNGVVRPPHFLGKEPPRFLPPTFFFKIF